MSEIAAAEQMKMPKHGEFCWTEIITKNLDECTKFYSEIFGWEVNQSTATGEEMKYLEYNTPGNYPMGGIFEMTEECQGGIPVPHFMNYIAVTDVDETASQAFDLGGKIVVPPMDIPNVGRFCQIQDPTGAMFSVITIKH
ncbi:hypothetical protein BH20ACI4_BH20ACI4_06560 [soil metagenome]